MFCGNGIFPVRAGFLGSYLNRYLRRPSRPLRTAKPFAAEGPVLRIHAGLEDAGDLIADLEQGLARMKDAT